MGDKMNREYFEPGATAFNYNNVTGGADSASGGSGGSGMECLQLRSPPGPFHYLISEQAKSLVALQELQNEVGALLEFRDLVIETFPNLRSKMAPSTPAGGARRDWEPGVRVRRKLAAGAGDARAKPQPSVQDSGFSTETSTSCGKDAHSSASATASQPRTRPLEDELWALLDVIQRKGVRLRDEAEQLRGELDERQTDTAEDEFARALVDGGCADCADVGRLRAERDALLLRAAQLEASGQAAGGPVPVCQAAASPAPSTPLGRLDGPLDTPARPPRVATPDSKKFAAILLESNPVELQRQLLTSTVQNQVLCERLRRAAAHRTLLLERLERARDINEDLKFRLEEKSIELDTTRALVKQLEERGGSGGAGERARRGDTHDSMRDMEPLNMPSGPESEPRVEPARGRPSRIPLHTAHAHSAHGAHSAHSAHSTHSAHKGWAPRPPPRPPSAHSAHSAHSQRSRSSRDNKSSVPVRRSPAAADVKRADLAEDWPESPAAEDAGRDSAGEHAGRDSAGEHAGRDSAGEHAGRESLAAEYVARAGRLEPLLPRLRTARTRPLPADLAYRSPHNLALELSSSVLYETADRSDPPAPRSPVLLWNSQPQHYFESMNYGERPPSDEDGEPKEYDSDSLAT